MKAEEEMRNINNEICETTVKSAPDIDTSKIISLLKHMREEIFAKFTHALLMVRRTAVFVHDKVNEAGQEIKSAEPNCPSKMID